MGPYRSFHGVSDVRDATLLAIIDEAIANRRPDVSSGDAITPGDLVSAASAYGIVLSLEDAATRIYMRAAHSGQ